MKPKQVELARVLSLKVADHQPAGGWGKAAGVGILIFKWGVGGWGFERRITQGLYGLDQMAHFCAFGCHGSNRFTDSDWIIQPCYAA